MSTPIVRIGFDLSAVGSPILFTLNDPVKGLLDSEFVLGGELFEDVTQYVRNVSVRRGRSRRLDKFQTGTATVTFDNRSRIFDPTYVDSPYFGNIKPRRPITVSIGPEFLFTGLVEDWNLEYDLSGDSIVTAACVDGFVLLAGTELSEHTGVVESSGDRVAAILDRPEVGWPAGSRNIANGSQQVQADTVSEGTNALSYLQLVETTEAGALFIDADGVLTFKGSNTPAAAIKPLVFTNILDVPVTGYDAIDVSYDAVDVSYGFASLIPGTPVQFRDISVEFGTETLFNRVTATRANSSTVVTVDDTVSQAEFGVSVLSQDGLLSASDNQLFPLASFFLNRYAEPLVRIRSIGLELRGNNNAPVLLGLEFGDVVRARFRPNNIGDPIDQFLTIEGVEHSITPNSHFVQFQFGSIAYFPFELDSSDYGILDVNVLGL
jgi:hypothetical protein